MRFAEWDWLHMVWLAPAVMALSVLAIARREAAVRLFIDAGLIPMLNAQAGRARLVVKAMLCAAALGLIAVALARPQWNPRPREVMRKGRDVCFLIDVSRSMLAEDLAPTRLERAKLWVRDVLTQASGDRVALVAFAGAPVVKCPLTHDYGFMRSALTDLSPESVTLGGTAIGDAVRIAIDEVFDPSDPRFKDIILITDGEDHESFPVEAAKAAGAAGIRIIAIGIGDEAGSPIPVTDARGQRTFLKDSSGQTVLSKLGSQTLRDMALASSDGVYLHVATGDIELDKVYATLVRKAEQKEMEASHSVIYDEQFQMFLAAALGLLILECLISERARRQHQGAFA